MSNEVKTKEKVDMDPKYIIKLTVTLFLTCMVVAGILGWVNSITKDKIAAITWEKTVAAMQQVITADDFSDAMELTDDMTAAAAAQGGTLDAVYEAQSGGQVVGYAINVEASGSQGIISMMVGIDTDGAVTGVSIVTNAETSGIGSKVMATSLWLTAPAFWISLSASPQRTALWPSAPMWMPSPAQPCPARA